MESRAVFLSYAREDRAKATSIAKALRDGGLPVWWDRSLQAGENYRDVIAKQLKAARCVVVLWSKHSVTSKWVADEADRGNDRAILVPVLLDDVRRDIPLGMGGLHEIDLRGWSGSSTPPALADLVKAVNSIVSRAKAAGVPPEARPRVVPRPSEQTLLHEPGVKVLMKGFGTVDALKRNLPRSMREALAPLADLQVTTRRIVLRYHEDGREQEIPGRFAEDAGPVFASPSGNGVRLTYSFPGIGAVGGARLSVSLELVASTSKRAEAIAEAITRLGARRRAR